MKSSSEEESWTSASFSVKQNNGGSDDQYLNHNSDHSFSLLHRGVQHRVCYENAFLETAFHSSAPLWGDNMNHNRDESSPQCEPDSMRVLARYQAAHEA